MTDPRDQIPPWLFVVVVFAAFMAGVAVCLWGPR
jgi:hypothetical protein